MTIPIVVQNADINLTKNFFKNFKEDELAVHGTFYTVQGEGPLAGIPAWFIRLAGCNFGAKDIACSFCDTAFSVMKSKVRTIHDLCNEFYSLCYGLGFVPVVVITGGEPLLQDNVEGLVSALLTKTSLYYVPNTKVQIETNGTQIPVVKRLLRDWEDEENFALVISPKTVKGSYGLEKDYGYKTGYYYKFVVSADPNNPHHEVPKWADNIITYVSPMTVYKKAYEGEVSSVWDGDLIDREATKANYEYAAKLAMKYGYRVSVQMHTFLNIA